MNQKRLVCLCNHVSILEIKKILKSGALTVADVQQFTAAGTGCGRCIQEITSIVEKHKTGKSKDSQLKISWE
jgi:bacterioferritin-associated ferredoxin